MIFPPQLLGLIFVVFLIRIFVLIFIRYGRM